MLPFRMILCLYFNYIQLQSTVFGFTAYRIGYSCYRFFAQSFGWCRYRNGHGEARQCYRIGNI